MEASPNLTHVQFTLPYIASPPRFLCAKYGSLPLSSPWTSCLPWLSPWGEARQPLPLIPCIQKKSSQEAVPREDRGCMRIMMLQVLFCILLSSLEFLSGEDLEGNLDTYWSGTAPLCLGGCKGKHKELKRSQCGNGSCCWLGYKSFCRVNCGRPEAEFNSVVYGNDWWVGSVVRYNCRPGYLLVGDPASACQSSGRWTPKPTCLRICLRGRIEINERDIDGSCSSTCPNKAHLGALLNHGCIKISSCITKQAGWTRWFSRCDFCECDCYVPCSSSG